MTSIPYLPGTSPEHYVVVWDAWNRLKRVTYTPSVVPGGSGSSGGSVAGSASYGSVSGSVGDAGSGSGSVTGVVSGSPSSSSGSVAAPALDVVYEYDGLFRRTRKRVLAGSTSGAEYYWNLNWKCVVQRYYDTSTVSSVNYYGARGRNDLIMKDLDGGSAHSGSRYYALSDAMFSSMAVVRPGFSVVAERYRYTAFGERAIMDVGYNPIPASLMAMDTFFHGEQIDEETRWYNYGFRYYVPQLGVWPSRDPIAEVYNKINNSVKSRILKYKNKNAISINIDLYKYANNNQINLFDTLGLVVAANTLETPEGVAALEFAAEALGSAAAVEAARLAKVELCRQLGKAKWDAKNNVSSLKNAACDAKRLCQSCPELRLRAELWKALALARWYQNTNCYTPESPGWQTHVDEQIEAYNHWKKCEIIMLYKNCSAFPWKQ